MLNPQINKLNERTGEFVRLFDLPLQDRTVLDWFSLCAFRLIIVLMHSLAARELF